MSFPSVRLKPWAYPLFLTVFALLIAAFVNKTRGFGFPMPQFIFPAIEFGEQHRIQSDFSPVGYTGFLGLGMMVTHADGISLVNVVIFVLLVLFCYLFLRMRNLAAPDAALIAAIVAMFPSVSASIFNVADTIFIAMFLFAILAMTLGVVRRQESWFFDVALAVILGCALSTRLNLLLLVPMIWLLWKRYGVPRLLPRIGLQALLVVGTYMAIAVAVHGHVFLPRYGAYALYSGANPFTSQHMNSEEDSIWDALPAQGILVATNSNCIVDYKQCFPNIYDAKLDPIYRKSALQYIKAHPLQTAWRCVLRVRQFLRPDFVAHSIKSLSSNSNELGSPLKWRCMDGLIASK